jgi:hypothetical protein
VSALQQSNSFSAHLALAAGVAVSITAETMEQLAGVVSKLQSPGLAANDSKPKADPKPETEKPKADSPKPPAPTSAPASVPPAVSGSEPAAEGPRPTYDDVKARVLALAKINRTKATEALGKFNVDHGNKLKLEDYPAFIKLADEMLKAA